MITSDVDEAERPSDRVVMMIKGPDAMIDEALQPALQRPRDRLALAADPASSRPAGR